MEHSQRANFGSKLGIILATAGSAVGLGNVWRFPYMVGDNGGGVFIVVYIVCMLLLGIPCMVSEFIIGRRAAANTARAYSSLTSVKAWGLVGYLGVAGCFLILGYYVVVSGWCLQYLTWAASGQLQGNPTLLSSQFSGFEQSALAPVLWAILFLVATHAVIMRGVQGGIEKASKLLMPLLFVLLVVIVVASCMLPGAVKGISFMLKPDFSALTGEVFLGALGQAFYSLSIGMGRLCTYASYFSKQTNLARSAIQIGIIDSIVAILAGLMIFPAAFSVGISPDSGPSLVFITLPNVFQQAFAAMPWVGYVVSVVFYALLALAALTSLISLHEVCTTFIQEECHTTRRRSALWVTLCASLMAALCSLSLGACDGLQIAGKPLFDFLDFFTGQIVLPVGGFLTCLYVGWHLPRHLVSDEFTNSGTVGARLFGIYLFCIRYICPIFILLVFLHQLRWV